MTATLDRIMKTADRPPLVMVKGAGSWLWDRDGACEIIPMHGSFHGRTLATMAASDKPGWDALFAPKVPGFQKVPLGDLDAVASAITPSTAAVMLESIQGEAGVVVAPDDYLRALRALTREPGILIILDEVQTGVG